MAKYLDSDGVLYFWQKIKAAFSAIGHTHTKSEITDFPTIPSAATANPQMDGTAAVGTSSKYAREDHVHAHDTSKANLASPTFTGTPKSTTATKGTNTTQIATTAFVQTALGDYTTTSDLSSNYALKSEITGVYKYKGSVATYANLPSSNLTAGDVYNVETDGQNYAWTGSAWDSLGEVFTIQSVTNAEIDTIVAS